jgi:hypothetical protein
MQALVFPILQVASIWSGIPIDYPHPIWPRIDIEYWRRAHMNMCLLRKREATASSRGMQFPLPCFGKHTDTVRTKSQQDSGIEMNSASTPANLSNTPIETLVFPCSSEIRVAVQDTPKPKTKPNQGPTKYQNAHTGMRGGPVNQPIWNPYLNFQCFHISVS